MTSRLFFAAALGFLLRSAAGAQAPPPPVNLPVGGIVDRGIEILVATARVSGAGRDPAPTVTPRSSAISSMRPDGSSVDAIVAALYESVSHGPEYEPNWERMRGIFLPVGMLIPPKRPQEDIFTVLDVDGFQDRVRKNAAAAKQKGEAPSGFFEREISRRQDCFGNVCQIFSTYESRHAPTDETPFVRGINSIQLVRDGRRWWIASVVWDTERTDNPIPPPYLPEKK